MYVCMYEGIYIRIYVQVSLHASVCACTSLRVCAFVRLFYGFDSAEFYCPMPSSMILFCYRCYRLMGLGIGCLALSSPLLSHKSHGSVNATAEVYPSINVLEATHVKYYAPRNWTDMAAIFGLSSSTWTVCKEEKYIYRAAVWKHNILCSSPSGSTTYYVVAPLGALYIYVVTPDGSTIG